MAGDGISVGSGDNGWIKTDRTKKASGNQPRHKALGIDWTNHAKRSFSIPSGPKSKPDRAINLKIKP